MVGRGCLLVVNITVGDSGSATWVHHCIRTSAMTRRVFRMIIFFHELGRPFFLLLRFFPFFFLFSHFFFWNATAYFAQFAIRGYAPGISFVYVLWVHCDFDLMIFLEREVKEQEDGVVVGVGCPLAEQLLPLISTENVHAVAKSTLSKVQIPRCQKGQSPTTLSEVDAVQSSTLSKKKVKIWRESDSIGPASQRPRTRLDECPDPVGSRPAPDTFPDPSLEYESSRFARSLNLPNLSILPLKRQAPCLYMLA